MASGHRPPRRNATRSRVATPSRSAGSVVPLRRGDAARLLAEVQASTGQAAAQSITAALAASVGAARNVLDAELLLSEYLGIAASAEASAAAAVGAPPPTDTEASATTELLRAIVGEAETSGSSDGLVLLRTVAAFALPDLSPVAAPAAERLVAAGVTAPEWSQRLGRPAFVSAWRMGDAFGAQTSMSVTFGYAHRVHALNVLVDHDLGGGVKDVWVAEGSKVALLRERALATASTEPMAVFSDVDAAAAHEILAAALTHPPCPEQPDQVECVRDNLALLRSRVTHLGEELHASRRVE